MVDIAEPLPNPPKGSDATSSRTNGQVVVVFPPPDVLRSYWINLLFIAVFAIAVTPLLFLHFDPPVLRLWRIIPFSIWAAGAYLLASTFQRGRTRTTITIGPESLSIEKTGPLFSTRRSWPIPKISEISLTGYRSVSLTVEGTVKRLSVNRSHADLRWLVEIVRSTLGMPPQSSHSPPLPAATKVVCERTGQRLKILVPPEWATLVLVAVPFLFLLIVGIFRLFHPQPRDDFSSMFATLSLSFLGVAVPLVLLWNRLKGPTIFELTSTELAVVRPFLIVRRHQQWDRNEIDDVTATGQTLTVWFKQSSRFRAEILLGGKPDDARWIAATIRHEMRLLADDPQTRE